MLDSRDSVSASVLFESPCLLELKEVVSDDEKAFLIGLILIRLCEHCEQRVRSSGLQHLTLIEEAHRLLRNTTTEQGGEVVANPRGRAIEVFANMLSEVRAHGEGILLAEQIPAKLVPDAIKSTNLKVVHRLVASDDRSLLGGAMHLNEAQERRLGLLGTGDAVVFRDGLQNSVMVRVPQSVSSGAAHLSDADLADRMMTQDRYHPVLADRGMACSTCVERGSRTRCGRIPGLVQSAEWTRALRRFLNDLRFLQSSLYESYHALKKTYESRSANRVQPFSCALNLATEAAVIQWGQRCDWNFADTERAVSLVGGAVKEIWDNKDSGSAAQPTESVRRCGEFLASLDADQERPFEACSACQAPCRYRVDVAPLVDRGRAIFQRMFEDKTVNWAGLVAMCRRATAEIVPLAAVGIREGVAMCFAAHQIGSLELTTQTQSELGKRFAIELVKGGSNGSV